MTENNKGVKYIIPKKIYISGKITGLSQTEAFANFERAEMRINCFGFEAINPMKKVSEQEGKSWKEYMLEDIAILWDCDAIYMLRNWEDSKGAKIERAIAEHLGITVLLETCPNDLIRYSRPDAATATP